MELGMVGLGKMGAFMVERLIHGGHRVVGYDRDAAAVARVVSLWRRRRRFACRPGRKAQAAPCDLDHGSFGRSGGRNDRRTLCRTLPKAIR